MARPKTAWVFSGGGSLGAVQVGMLQALAEAGVQADFLIGASVGALNAAFYSQAPTVEGVARLAGLWRRLRRKDVFPLTLLAGLKALLLRRDHLVEPDALRVIIAAALDVRRIEETRVPLHVVATDAMTGAEVLLSSGAIDVALLASTAIPVVFPPVVVAGRRLIDGGVGSNTPITGALALGAQRILVLPTGTSCALQEPPRDMAARALQVMSLLSMRQLDRDVQHCTALAEIVIVPPLCPLAVSAFDFSQTVALIERAAAQTRDWLASGGLRRSGPLHVPLAHQDRLHAVH